MHSGESPEAKAINKSWAKLSKLGLQFAGFIAPLVLRPFPWLAPLPMKLLLAQADGRAYRDASLPPEAR